MTKNAASPEGGPHCSHLPATRWGGVQSPWSPLDKPMIATSYGKESPITGEAIQPSPSLV